MDGRGPEAPLQPPHAFGMADVIEILDEKLLSNSHYNNPEGFLPDWYISLLSFVEMYPVWYRLGGSKLKRAC